MLKELGLIRVLCSFCCFNNCNGDKTHKSKCIFIINLGGNMFDIGHPEICRALHQELSSTYFIPIQVNKSKYF
jgi:hypothetical protein